MSDALPKSRWFQFGLGEILLLISLMSAIWWQAAVRPIEMPVEEYGASGANFVVVPERPPRPIEIVRRGAIGSGTVLLLWMIGRETRRRFSR
jgi:hypothetical protein